MGFARRVDRVPLSVAFEPKGDEAQRIEAKRSASSSVALAELIQPIEQAAEAGGRDGTAPADRSRRRRHVADRDANAGTIPMEVPPATPTP
jgi:hypothetical protein